MMRMLQRSGMSVQSNIWGRVADRVGDGIWDITVSSLWNSIWFEVRAAGRINMRDTVARSVHHGILDVLQE